MKKKLMILSLGVLGLFTSSYAQPTAPTYNLTGIMVSTSGIPGTFVQVTAGQALAPGTFIMYNNQMFAIRPTPAPNNQIPIAENIAFVFGQYNVVVDGNGNLVNNTSGTNGNGDFFFGTSLSDYTVVAIPFDFGITAVLGAGAIAAVRTARRRRKEEELTKA